MRRLSPFGLPVLALLALLPAPSRGSPPEIAREVPDVLLEKMTVTPDGATAPLAAGGSTPLTIDPALQRAADRLLAAARPVAGTVVMLHAPTGRVLAFHQFSRSRDAGRPLYEARAPSASVFKIVTSAALLETGRIDPQTVVCFAGGNHSIERRHLDPPREGKINCAPFGTALGHSRNAVFAQLATSHLGRSDLIDMAARFGFNKLLPFDYPILLGTLKVPYNDLEFARAAAGFEGSALSPLGAAYLGYVVAAGGLAPRLRVLKHPPGASNPTRLELTGRVMRPWAAQKLTRMMELTVHGGTSFGVFSDETGRSLLGDLRVAGKTGTLHRAHDGSTTSWFVGFAPSRSPEIVISVMLLNADVWRSKANEVARDMLRVYFAGRGRSGIADPLADQTPE
jgi:cell division protein FtsI/penicillin-binding protein 2